MQYSLSGLVEVDDGLPEIVLGLNQTFMFGLFMMMIAEFIGTVDLSQGKFSGTDFLRWRQRFGDRALRRVCRINGRPASSGVGGTQEANVRACLIAIRQPEIL